MYVPSLNTVTSFSHSTTEAGPPMYVSASSLLLAIVFPSSLRYCDKSLTNWVLLLMLHQNSSLVSWLVISFLAIHLRLDAVFVFSLKFHNFSSNFFHIHQKQPYMLQSSLLRQISRVISTKVFPIQKSFCKVSSLSKIR